MVSQSKKSEKDHKEVVYSISPLRKMNTNPVENVEYSKTTCLLMSTNGSNSLKQRWSFPAVDCADSPPPFFWLDNSRYFDIFIPSMIH